MRKPIYEVRIPFEDPDKLAAVSNSLIKKLGRDYYVVVIGESGTAGIKTRILSEKRNFWDYIFNRQNNG